MGSVKLKLNLVNSELNVAIFCGCSCIAKASSHAAASETSKVSISILMKRCEVILGQFLADENDLGNLENNSILEFCFLLLIILMYSLKCNFYITNKLCFISLKPH